MFYVPCYTTCILCIMYVYIYIVYNNTLLCDDMIPLFYFTEISLDEDDQIIGSEHVTADPCTECQQISVQSSAASGQPR